MIELIRRLVEIPSVTGGTAVEDPEYGLLPFGREVFDTLIAALDYCESLGFKTKNCGNYCGWAEVGEGQELIGILAHLDVVPAGEGWETDPFKVIEKDGAIFGRGVADDKGPAAAAIFAIKDLLNSGIKINKRIRIIFGCQEEEGDWLDMDYYKEHEEIPSYGFTPDADFPAIYGEKAIMIAQLDYPKKGSGIMSVHGGIAENVVPNKAELVLQDGRTFYGEGVQAHASMPQKGRNAISDLMSKVTDCSSFARLYMDKIGFNIHGENMGCNFGDSQSGRLTMSVGVITSDEESIHMEIDIRCPVTFSKEQVLDGMKTALEGTPATISSNYWLRSVYMDKNGSVMKTLLEAYRGETGDMTEPKVIGGGTYARAMDNIIAFGPVFPGQPCTEHMANEFVAMEDLNKARKIYYNALKSLLTL